MASQQLVKDTIPAPHPGQRNFGNAFYVRRSLLGGSDLASYFGSAAAKKDRTAGQRDLSSH
jgi:hypothetical protein